MILNILKEPQPHNISQIQEISLDTTSKRFEELIQHPYHSLRVLESSASICSYNQYMRFNVRLIRIILQFESKIDKMAQNYKKS